MIRDTPSTYPAMQCNTIQYNAMQYNAMQCDAIIPIQFDPYNTTLLCLIIYMKKLLDSDWLRTVQFFLNTVQKRGN